MRRVFQLFSDSVRCRWASLIVLSLQLLVASLIVVQTLFLVGNLVSASDRLAAFTPLIGWYQLNDSSDEATFQQISSGPGFESGLSRLLAWMREGHDVELLMLPKTSLGVSGATGDPLSLYLVTGNLAQYFDLELSQGTWLDCGATSGRRPVVLGHALGDRYKVGDTLAAGYYVSGILAPNARCYDIGAGMQPIELDEIMMTAIDENVGDAGTLDGILNSPIVRFRSADALAELTRMTRRYGLYDYRFWRLDDFLRYYTSDLRRQIAAESSAAGLVLSYAVSAFLLAAIRSISTRRREFGVHLAYGAGHLDFWLASSLELIAVVVIAGITPLAMMRPPYWLIAAAALLALAALVALLPTIVLSRRSIPDLLRGSDG